MNKKSKKQIKLNNEFRKVPSVERILSNKQIIKITDGRILLASFTEKYEFIKIGFEFNNLKYDQSSIL